MTHTLLALGILYNHAHPPSLSLSLSLLNSLSPTSTIPRSMPGGIGLGPHWRVTDGDLFSFELI